MHAKKAKNYGNVRNSVLRWILQTPLGAIASHWAFQGLLYMDPTERWFKLGLDCLLTYTVRLLFRRFFSGGVAWVIGWTIAHSFNFLFNGQIWGILKHYGFVSNTREQFDAYQTNFAQRAQRESSIERTIAYGSLSRKEWSPSSDLDVRLVRRPGMVNGVRACWFLLRERSRALVARFPLDAYVVDSPQSLKKLRDDEVAIEL